MDSFGFENKDLSENFKQFCVNQASYLLSAAQVPLAKVSQNQNKVFNQNQQMAGFTSVNEYGWFSTSGRKSENVQLKNQNVNNKAACITQNLLKVLDNLRHITSVEEHY